MIHDKLCPTKGRTEPCMECDLILKVRNDCEDIIYQAVTFGYKVGYELGLIEGSEGR